MNQYDFGIAVVLAYKLPIVLAQLSSNTESYSKEIFESLYVAAISPLHKIFFSEEFNSSLTIRSYLSPKGIQDAWKNPNSKVL